MNVVYIVATVPLIIIVNSGQNMFFIFLTLQRHWKSTKNKQKLEGIELLKERNQLCKMQNYTFFDPMRYLLVHICIQSEESEVDLGVSGMTRK